MYDLPHAAPSDHPGSLESTNKKMYSEWIHVSAIPVLVHIWCDQMKDEKNI